MNSRDLSAVVVLSLFICLCGGSLYAHDDGQKEYYMNMCVAVLYKCALQRNVNNMGWLIKINGTKSKMSFEQSERARGGERTHDWYADMHNAEEEKGSVVETFMHKCKPVICAKFNEKGKVITIMKHSIQLGCWSKHWRIMWMCVCVCMCGCENCFWKPHAMVVSESGFLWSGTKKKVILLGESHVLCALTKVLV